MFSMCDAFMNRFSEADAGIVNHQFAICVQTKAQFDEVCDAISRLCNSDHDMASSYLRDYEEMYNKYKQSLAIRIGDENGAVDNSGWCSDEWYRTHGVDVFSYEDFVTMYGCRREIEPSDMDLSDLFL